MRVKQFGENSANFSGPTRPEYSTEEALEHHKNSSVELRRVARQFFDWEVEW